MQIGGGDTAQRGARARRQLGGCGAGERIEEARGLYDDAGPERHDFAAPQRGLDSALTEQADQITAPVRTVQASDGKGHVVHGPTPSRPSGILQITCGQLGGMWTTRPHAAVAESRLAVTETETRRLANGDSPSPKRRLAVTDAETRLAGPDRHRGAIRAARAARVSTRTPKGRARSSRSKVGAWMSRIGPVPDHTPRRAMAPGTCSRYQAKSSPPLDCSVLVDASGPPMANAASASISELTASFTTGGTPRT